jgi:ArsR family transcriptional regulator
MERHDRRPPSVADLAKSCCTLALTPAEERQLVRMFRALGNPIRFRILKFLLTRPGCITGDIVEHLPIAQATVSQHLKVLREAGWVSGLTEGTARCYWLNAERIGLFKRLVQEAF